MRSSISIGFPPSSRSICSWAMVTYRDWSRVDTNTTSMNAQSSHGRRTSTSAFSAISEASELLIDPPTIGRGRHVEHGTQIPKAAVGATVGEVAHPQLARVVRFKITFHKSGARCVRSTTVRSAHAFAPCFGLQTKLVHQAAHTMRTDSFALLTQRMRDSGLTITFFVRRKEALNLGRNCSSCTCRAVTFGAREA